MIYGIGTDIVEIARMREAVRKWGDRFLRRIFTEAELSYCCRKKDPAPCLAARFAAKESFIKAFDPEGGIAHLRDIEVVNGPTGKPFIRPGGGLAKSFPAGGPLVIHLSLTHEQSHAAATVILERKAEYRV